MLRRPPTRLDIKMEDAKELADAVATKKQSQRQYSSGNAAGGQAHAPLPPPYWTPAPVRSFFCADGRCPQHATQILPNNVTVSWGYECRLSPRPSQDIEDEKRRNSFPLFCFPDTFCACVACLRGRLSTKLAFLT